jgi:hypothetical protein
MTLHAPGMFYEWAGRLGPAGTCEGNSVEIRGGRNSRLGVCIVGRPVEAEELRRTIRGGAVSSARNTGFDCDERRQGVRQHGGAVHDSWRPCIFCLRLGGGSHADPTKNTGPRYNYRCNYRLVRLRFRSMVCFGQIVR